MTAPLSPAAIEAYAVVLQNDRTADGLDANSETAVIALAENLKDSRGINPAQVLASAILCPNGGGNVPHTGWKTDPA